MVLEEFSERVQSVDGQWTHAGYPLDADEQTMYYAERVQLIADDEDGNEHDKGLGKLLVSSRRVYWMSDTHASMNYMISFVKIAMHAIAREPVSCLFCQFDTDAEEDDKEESEKLVGSVMYQVRFIPQTAQTVNELYTVFSNGVSMNPGSQEEDSENDEEEDDEDDEDDEWDEEEDGDEEYGQFDDAELNGDNDQ
jgi:hypothetical protein